MRFLQTKLPLLIALALLLTGCDVFAPGSGDDDERLLGQVLWSYDLAHPEAVDFTKPAIDGAYVYVAGGHELLCFELETGTVRWKLPLPRKQTSYTVEVDEQQVYLIVDHQLWAVDKQDGTPRWKMPIDFALVGRDYLTQTASHLWVGGSRSDLARYRKEDGQRDLAIRLEELKPEGVDQRAGGPVVQTSDGYLYVPASFYVEPGIEGNVLTYDATTGAFRWGHPFREREVPIPGYPGQFWTMDVDVNGVVIQGDFLIAASKSAVKGMNRHTGELRWERLFNDDGFWYPPVLGHGLVYLGSVDGYVFALDPETGETVWRSEQMGASILTQLELQDGRIYVDNGGQIWVLDARSGSTLWHGAPPELDADAIYLSPVAAGGGYMVNVGSVRVYGLAAPLE
jgi:outer membrane protein assembly factor BamB